jgi:nitric oxide synthase oxygenase domain/subunit
MKTQEQTILTTHSKRIYAVSEPGATSSLEVLKEGTRAWHRLHWQSLVVRDCRALRSAEEIFSALIEHVRLSTGTGKVVPMITIFAPEHSDQRPVRIWNRQLIDYAGYRRSDGSILGDPLNVRFSEVVANWAGFATRQAPSKM